MIASLVIGGMVLLAMVGVSCYGWVTLPADARVPIHFGAGFFFPVVMCVLLIVQAGAIKVARSRSGTFG